MEFFKLTQNEYKNYLATVRNLLAENNFQYEGVAFFVVSSMTELENMAKQNTWNKCKLPFPVYDKFCNLYRKAETTFVNRFKMFFERCVKDEVIFTHFIRTLGAVEEYVVPFIFADEKIFTNLYERTVSGNSYNNMEEFAKLLNTQALDIARLAEECRQSCYY
jgi:hypothetical protein